MKSYVISKCIPQTLENKLGIKLSSGTKEELEKLEQQYIEEFRNYLSPDVKYVTLDYDEVKQPILDFIVKDDNPIISLDEIYFNEKDTPNISDSFSITRTVSASDPLGEYTLESRVGFPSIKEQLEDLANKYAGKNVSLVDVGIFSGDTLVALIKDLAEYEINVERVYVAICGKDSLKTVDGKNYFNNGFEGNVEVIVNEEQKYVFEDWLELRDMVWIDGRNVDTSTLQGYEESRVFIPYRENPQKFMSICSENIDDVIELGDKYLEKINQCIKKDGYQLSLEKIGDNVFYEMNVFCF